MNNTLRQLQMTQLEMLKIVDRKCRRHGISYSLYAGTLLGAVRHQGFIPWDDDLDICMSREDYNRFIQIWNEEPEEGYTLMNQENSPKFTQSFTKIRKDHTTFLQSKEEIGKFHTGIFIDIFPLDRMPLSGFAKLRFYWDAVRYQLLVREYVPQNDGVIKKFAAYLLLCCIPPHGRAQVRQNLLNRISANNGNVNLPVVGLETMSSLMNPFFAEMLDTYVDLKFEDQSFMCFAQWDRHLRIKFGNYMQLPPEEDRCWKHHPVIISFDKNCDTLIQEGVLTLE